MILKSRSVKKFFKISFDFRSDPNAGPSAVPLTWPQFNSETRQKLEFTETPRILTEDGAMLERYRFWQEEYPTITLPKDPWNIGLGFSEYNGDIPSSPEEGLIIIIIIFFLATFNSLRH
jgi:hypothetical protein